MKIKRITNIKIGEQKIKLTKFKLNQYIYNIKIHIFRQMYFTIIEYKVFIFFSSRGDARKDFL